MLTLRRSYGVQRTNVASTLKFSWKWKLSRRMFIDIVSTLTKQRWNNIDRIASIQRRWPNVLSTLVVSWKWNLSQRMFIGVASTLRKQHLNNFINCCTNVYKKVAQKQNKIKFSSKKTYISFIWEHNQIIVLSAIKWSYRIEFT